MTLHDEVGLPAGSSVLPDIHGRSVEIEDMDWNEELQAFTYECPCGDLFQISMEELEAGEEIAHCPSCSLYVRVIYDPEDFSQKASLPGPEPILVA
ncbi:Diphthamide biosynthesis protein 3 [Auxenochlorella protothecoides]|uniref:Diphthamide biosynthesis protein 3 n=1 Tax=Auxenochlorella protothecoides TaxID=3075 RepID=A0A087SHV2_AUXPR|nr:Diphthamide biosynthesis protein 3 [Auxenochlorella protothecoides]KFM25306.1 Diphthamide biosynthesis protein 3 [Auxenochlorella protothecoides]